MAVYATKLPNISLGYGDTDVKMLIADFPFDYGNYLEKAAVNGIGEVPEEKFGTLVAVIGGGVAGLVSAYELMRIGLKPIVYEISDFSLGGRFNSQSFSVGGSDGPFAEMGAMRFPTSATSLFHYIDLLNLPNGTLSESFDLGGLQHSNRPTEPNILRGRNWPRSGHVQESGTQME